MSGAFVICFAGSCFNVGTCAEFMAAWKSEYENCHTCSHWDRDELTCLNKEEIAKRKKIKEYDDIEKMAKRNKPVTGPL